MLFRMYDIRIYHAFGSGEVIREIMGTEADYETIKGVRVSRLSPFPLPNCRLSCAIQAGSRHLY